MTDKEPRASFRRIVPAHDERGRAVILEDAPPPRSGSKHAFMHRTETIDYGIVLEGDITLIDGRFDRELAP